MQSSAELRREIAALESEILHLERYLISLYRTAFEEHLPISSQRTEASLHCNTGSSSPVVSNESCDKLKPYVCTNGFSNPDQASPVHNSSVSDDASAASLKGISKRVSLLV